MMRMSRPAPQRLSMLFHRGALDHHPSAEALAQDRDELLAGEIKVPKVTREFRLDICVKGDCIALEVPLAEGRVTDKTRNGRAGQLPRGGEPCLCALRAGEDAAVDAGLAGVLGPFRLQPERTRRMIPS
jgi:hypothetical protein